MPSGSHLVGKRGPGRRPGSLNKNTHIIRDMIVGALDELGGIAWLKKQAEKHPAAFMQLIGKVMPLQLVGHNGGAIQIERIERVIVDGPQKDNGHTIIDAEVADGEDIPTTH